MSQASDVVLTRLQWRGGGADTNEMTKLALISALGAAVIVAALALQRDDGTAGFGPGSHLYREDAKISIHGLAGITIPGDPLYAKDDPWLSYLAPESLCPGGEALDAPLAAQAQTMVCLVNFARARRGLDPVSPFWLLDESSRAKDAKIVRCTDFDHDACGEDAAIDARRAGFNGAWGENLYIAEGRLGSPRVSLDGWLNSPEHRENLFIPSWRVQGIAVEKVAEFGDDRNVTVWVSQFGS